jgi:hypothetical protein
MDPINCIYKTYNLWERKKILLIKIFSNIVGHNNGTLIIILQLLAMLEIQICTTLLLVDATPNYHARTAEPPNQSNLVTVCMQPPNLRLQPPNGTPWELP